MDKIIGLLLSLLIATAHAAPPASLVQTAPVSKGALKSYQTFIGTVFFNQSSVLASQAEGLALQVNFDTTQQVKKGEVLVELDHKILDSKIRTIQAQLREIELQLEKGLKDLKRYKQLLKQKSVSQQKYDDVYYNKIGLEQKQIALQAELESLEIERGQAIIKAPFDGIISARKVDVGEWVSKGGTIATLINPDNIDVIFNIPTAEAISIEKNSRMDVLIAGNTYSGTVAGVIIDGDDKSRTFPLKIRLDNIQQQALFEGMEARVRLQNNSAGDTLLVPRDAVIKRFGQDVVFVDSDQTAKMIPVTVLLYNGSTAAVKGDELQAGMLVITKGNERIFPNQSIKTKISQE